MNRNAITKLSILCVSLFSLGGCAYHQAMEEQKERKALIASNLSKESNITKEQEIEKLKLDKELALLKSEVLVIDKEIAAIKLKTEEITLENKKKEEAAYKKQLAILENKKAKLQKDISEKKAIIATL